MAEELSKYASNQFDVATVGSFPLMSEILADTRPRLAQVTEGDSRFDPALVMLDEMIAEWDAGETVVANAEAALPGRTLAFEDKLESITRKPDADTNSLLETWDVIIRSAVAYQGPTYLALLPNGRETLTVGSYDVRLDAGRDFAIRLSQQAGKPTLIALGTTVGSFYNAARTLRTQQLTAKTELEEARAQQELLRVKAAGVLLNMVGLGLQVWHDTPAQVDTLFSVSLLRGGTQTLPAAPADTLWTPATRTLSTTALPTGATRLEAWREGPGGMPEQLALGDSGATEVTIPATITFDPGELYQLWLVARNSRGPSAPGPVQNWTAP
jgi:hypothetical protein